MDIFPVVRVPHSAHRYARCPAVASRELVEKHGSVLYMENPAHLYFSKNNRIFAKNINTTIKRTFNQLTPKEMNNRVSPIFP